MQERDGRRRLDLGFVEVSDDWTQVTEVVVRKPAAVGRPMHLVAHPGATSAGGQPTLLLQRLETERDAAVYLDHFMKGIAETEQGAKVSEVEPLVFADGVSVRCFRAEFELMPPLTQLHACRVDDGFMTHFVVAAPTGDTGSLQELLSIAASWRPPVA